MPVPPNLSRDQFLAEFNAGVPVNVIRDKYQTSHRVIARYTKDLGLKRRSLPPRTSPDLTLVGQRFHSLEITGFEFDAPSRCWYATLRCLCGNTGKDVVRKVVKGLRQTCGISGCPHFHDGRRRHGKKAGFTGYQEILGSRWASWRIGAESRGLKFDISLKYAWELFLKQERRCALTGLLLTFAPTHAQLAQGTASLDRIDSSKGYLEGNVQWVHKRVNQMKLNDSDETFIAWCRRVVTHQDRPREK